MANFTFSCPQCGQHLEAQEEWRGQETQCPACNVAIIVPDSGQNQSEYVEQSPSPIHSSNPSFDKFFLWVAGAFVTLLIMFISILFIFVFQSEAVNNRTNQQYSSHSETVNVSDEQSTKSDYNQPSLEYNFLPVLVGKNSISLELTLNNWSDGEIKSWALVTESGKIWTMQKFTAQTNADKTIYEVKQVVPATWYAENIQKDIVKEMHIESESFKGNHKIVLKLSDDKQRILADFSVLQNSSPQTNVKLDENAIIDKFAQKGIEFMGITIYGDISDFLTKLQEKGHYIKQTETENQQRLIVQLKGPFWNDKDAEIILRSLKNSNSIGEVEVRLEMLEDQAKELLLSLAKKYGKPAKTDENSDYWFCCWNLFGKGVITFVYHPRGLPMQNRYWPFCEITYSNVLRGVEAAKELQRREEIQKQKINSFL